MGENANIKTEPRWITVQVTKYLHKVAGIKEQWMSLGDDFFVKISPETFTDEKKFERAILENLKKRGKYAIDFKYVVTRTMAKGGKVLKYKYEIKDTRTGKIVGTSKRNDRDAASEIYDIPKAYIDITQKSYYADEDESEDEFAKGGKIYRIATFEKPYNRKVTLFSGTKKECEIELPKFKKEYSDAEVQEVTETLEQALLQHRLAIPYEKGGNVTTMPIIARITTKPLNYTLTIGDKAEKKIMPPSTYDVVAIEEMTSFDGSVSKIYITNQWYKEHKRIPLVIIEGVVDKIEMLKAKGGEVLKRYATDIDFYQYAKNDEEVIEKAKKVVNDMRDKLDNQAQINEIREVPFASLKSRKLENVPKYEEGGDDVGKEGKGLLRFNSHRAREKFQKMNIPYVELYDPQTYIHYWEVDADKIPSIISQVRKGVTESKSRPKELFKTWGKKEGGKIDTDYYQMLIDGYAKMNDLEGKYLNAPERIKMANHLTVEYGWDNATRIAFIKYANDTYGKLEEGGEMFALTQSGEVKIKTPKKEYTIEVGDISADEATKRVRAEYPNFTEFEYKRIQYKKRGKKGEFLTRIEPQDVLDARWDKKKNRIRQLSENIKSLRNNVTRDLNSEDEKTFLCALIIAIMDKTGERVGNDESADNGHYGVTGFRQKHVSVRGDQVEFDYVGKSGVKHEKMFSDEKIAKGLKRAMKDGKGLFVFTTSQGQRIRASQVNDYLSKFGVTAKDIRGYSANKWTLDKLKEVKPEDTDKKRKRQLNIVLKQVAAQVGHGAATLKKHYLMPEVVSEWIDNGKLFDITKAGYVMKKGGKIKSEEMKHIQGKDLFDEYDKLPKKVQDILMQGDEDGATKAQLDKMIRELKPLGYTFDYGLALQGYNLRKIKAEGGTTNVYSTEETKRIADTILHQIPVRTRMYVGAHQYMFGEKDGKAYLKFKASGAQYKKGLYITIFYNEAMDWYEVKEDVVFNYKHKEVGNYDMVHNDQLSDFILKITEGDKRANGGELAKGVDVEKEHKDLYLKLKRRLLAQGVDMPMSEQEFYETIAKRHLKEDEDYYKLLMKYVEKKAKGGSIKDALIQFFGKKYSVDYTLPNGEVEIKRVVVDGEEVDLTKIGSKLKDALISEIQFKEGIMAKGGQAGVREVVFTKKVNPQVKVIVKVQGSRIIEIINERKVHFPFHKGQMFQMNVQEWARVNGYSMDGKNLDREEKIFGVRVSDVPQGHEWRFIYPNKFREEGGNVAEGGKTIKTRLGEFNLYDFNDLSEISRKSVWANYGGLDEKGRSFEPQDYWYDKDGTIFGKKRVSGKIVEKAEGGLTNLDIELIEKRIDVIQNKIKDINIDFAQRGTTPKQLKERERLYELLNPLIDKYNKIPKERLLAYHKENKPEMANGGMTNEDIISKYQLWGKGIRLKFKNDQATYYSKNIHPDRKSIFVTTMNGFVIKNKKIADIVAIENKPLRFAEGGEVGENDIKENDKITHNGDKGGMLDGPSHADGGIKTYVRANNDYVEVEGGESIINKHAMAMKEKVVCEGTPAGVASAVNQLAGNGVKFADNGKCKIVKK